MYKPKPVHVKDDFYAVENTGWLPVNKKGEYLDKNGVPSTGYIEGFYKYLRYDFYRNGRRNIGFLHRAVALTFLECDGDPDDFVVNHIDGNKENNSLDNLEWATLSENILHAYKTGLRTDNRQIKVRNIKTNEEKEFYSLTECARYFSVNQGSVTKYLQRKDRMYPWKGEWELAYSEDEYPGITMDKLKSSTFGTAKKVLAISDDRSFLFHSCGCAAAAIGCSASLLKWYLSGKATKGNRLYKGYQWWYLEDYKKSIPDNVVEDKNKVKYNKSPTRRKPSEVKVINLLTNEEKVYESLWVVSSELGIKKNTLEKYIKINDGIVMGRKFIYLNKTKQYK